MPHCWGSEAISYRTDLYKGDPAQLSYGSLWDEGVKGHVQGRPHSYLLSIGLWWDGNGKMPSNRMLDGYKDEESFKKVWDPILAFAIEHKAWVKQFWDSADNTKSGLMENDVWIGLTWDGPPLSLKKEGKPVNYTAPKEGAIAWVDGLSLLKAAKNVDQVYAFLELPGDAGSFRSRGRRFGLQPGRHRRRCAALGTWPRRTSRKPSRAMRSRTCGPGRPSRPGMPKSAASTPTSSRRPDRTIACRKSARRKPGLIFLTGHAG